MAISVQLMGLVTLMARGGAPVCTYMYRQCSIFPPVPTEHTTLKASQELTLPYACSPLCCTNGLCGPSAPNHSHPSKILILTAVGACGLLHQPAGGLLRFPCVARLRPDHARCVGCGDAPHTHGARLCPCVRVFLYFCMLVCMCMHARLCPSINKIDHLHPEAQKAP